MAAANPLQLSSAPEGLSLVVARAGLHHPAPALQVLARSVRVDEASGLRELLEMDLPGVGVTAVLANRAPLLGVEQAAHLLRLLKGSILGDLRREPTQEAYLVILEGIAATLRVDTVAAGGGFNPWARAMAQALEAFVHEARAHDVFGPYATLRDSVDNLVRQANEFLESTLTLRHQPLPAAAAQGAAAAEEAQGAAAEAEEAQAEAAAVEAQGAAAAEEEE